MAYLRKSGWWSAAALVLGGLSAPLVVALIWLVSFLFPGSGLLTGTLVVLCIGVFHGPFLSSFLLTILMPRAYDWSLSSGYAVACALFAVIELAAGGERATGGAVLLPVSAVVWMVGYGGVVAGRRSGPLRCCDPRYALAGEPQCPGCGYTLYHAKYHRCPDCGRRFHLREIDLRRAVWDGYVLKPREPGQPV